MTPCCQRLGDRFDADVFADVPNPRAKILANFGVGYNHIDASAAKAAGIAVSNTPGAVTDATADIAMTLILMTARRAGEGERMLRAGKWAGLAPDADAGHACDRAPPLASSAWAASAKPLRGAAISALAWRCCFTTAPPLADIGLPATQVSLAEAMAADFVVVAVPGGPATQHLINAACLCRHAAQGHFHQHLARRSGG